MPKPRVCPTCNQKFDITKWQKSKIYCTEVCKPTWRPNRGGAVGRPKAKK